MHSAKVSYAQATPAPTSSLRKPRTACLHGSGGPAPRQVARLVSRFAQAAQSGTWLPCRAQAYTDWLARTSPGHTSAHTPGARPSRSRRPAPTEEDVALLAKILLLEGADGDTASCGFRHWPAQPSTPLSTTPPMGSFEDRVGILKDDDKPWAHEQALAASTFAEEWSALKSRFHAQTQGRSEFLRTPTQEWGLEASPDFSSEEGCFQAALDLLCWKYCLWGVRADRPLLMKPTARLTPYGTQIFIPAYLSFDARRDLDWPAVRRLHAPLGIPRQGAKLAKNRLQFRDLCVAAALSDREAKALGLKGEARFDHVRASCPRDFTVNSDPSHIRRCISRGNAFLSAAGD